MYQSQVRTLRESAVHFDGDTWIVRNLDFPCRRVWGAHASCAYAFSENLLFYFDGNEWIHVDLAAQGIPGDRADGDCDSTGTGWVVGTWETHSYMATGHGRRWRRDACGSWYLYRVCIDDGGVGFAAGGDGLRQRSPSRGLTGCVDVGVHPQAVWEHRVAAAQGFFNVTLRRGGRRSSRAP
jgi:hypothetical protein